MCELYSEQNTRGLIESLDTMEYVIIPIALGVLLRATRISPDQIVYADIRNGIPMAIDEDKFYKTLNIMTPDLRNVRRGYIEPVRAQGEA